MEKGDEVSLDKFKNLVRVPHQRKKGRVALSKVSASLRAQNKQDIYAQHRLNYLRAEIHSAPDLELYLLH